MTHRPAPPASSGPARSAPSPQKAPTPARRTRRKTGSEFSDKQIRLAVVGYRRITATLTDNEKISGWIFGSDNYHWGVVDKRGATHLIHKSAPAISVTRETLDADYEVDGERRAEIHSLVDPFRAFLISQFPDTPRPAAN